MPGNGKKNGVFSMIMEVFRGKREDCGDIVYQAERIVSDYISRRRNEIVNKYCKKKNPLLGLSVIGALGILFYVAYVFMI